MIDLKRMREIAEENVSRGDAIAKIPHASSKTVVELLDMLQAAQMDAARWGMLPAVAEDHQINLMGLYRDVDAELEKRSEP